MNKQLLVHDKASNTTCRIVRHIMSEGTKGTEDSVYTYNDKQRDAPIMK